MQRARNEAAVDAGRWHRARARGHRERFERAIDCASEERDFISIDCAACGGNVQKKRDGCGCGLVCVHCRGVRAYRKRAKFATARNVVLERASQQGLLSEARPGGRWSEKLLTLTMPHVAADEDDASDGRVIKWRIETALVAWRAFTRIVLKWLARERNGALQLGDRQRTAVWFRSLEWTPAADRLGHPHMHVWFFGPFLDRELLKAWWGRALSCAFDDPRRPSLSMDPHALECVVLDVREVRGGDGAAREVIKYMTKDLDSDGRLLPAVLYAAVYEALDGVRVTQATSGFMALARDDAPAITCPNCGVCDARVNARRVRHGDGRDAACAPESAQQRANG